MAIDGRLLTVLKSINDLGICTVVDLHRATGISRPAVHRIVESLCNFGYIERVDGKSAVRLTSLILSLSSGYRPENQLAEQAAPVLDDLQKRIRWPHTFAAPEDDMMVLQATTRDRNPFVFDRGRTGLRLPMVSTAIGCAYLSRCAADEREPILARWRNSHPQDHDHAEIFAAARYRIANAADKGFALRSGGEPERTTTIAVPVIVFSTPVGALCTTYPTSAMQLEDACTRYVPQLQEAARAIAQRCEN